MEENLRSRTEEGSGMLRPWQSRLKTTFSKLGSEAEAEKQNICELDRREMAEILENDNRYILTWKL